MSSRLIEITDPTQDRYATLNLIPWWNQKRLAQARIMVVGAGALGNEVLKNLALLGVGHLLVVDFDRIEASNLSRSILFRHDDKGQRKADVAAQRIREINPDVHVVAYDGDVTTSVGLGVFRQMDLVFGCLDSRSARLAVNRACWHLNVPWIDGALDVLMGTVRFFAPPDGPCYECTMTEQDYALMNLRYSCPMLRPEDLAEGRMLTTPTSASIIGALQVQEAVKYLHGLEVVTGKSLYFNGHKHQLMALALTRRADCCSHEFYEPVSELEAGVDDLSVAGFLEQASAALGQSVTLLLDDEIVTQFYCPHCRQTEPIYMPYDMVVPKDVACPQCHGNRIPRVAVRLGLSEEGFGIPLRQIGVPAMHILRVQTSDGRHYFELAGDREAVLPGWQA